MKESMLSFDFKPWPNRSDIRQGYESMMMNDLRAK